MIDRNDLDHAIRQAADAIRDADALLIAAGAGMGVDSGLPDFRGNEGFWKAYPPYRRLGLSFVELANPAWFSSDPPQAWGFYGHRLALYRAARPHAGFELLRTWAAARPGGAFVFTSNVDGQFQRAGFSPQRIVECHGSIHYLQCAAACHDAIWEADGIEVEVDLETMRAATPLPACPRCGGPARPNILMFGDGRWLDRRTVQQERRYRAWLAAQDRRRLVAIECGAGRAIPTVRYECQQQAATLIRINPRDFEAPPGAIAIALGAREALERIGAAMG